MDTDDLRVQELAPGDPNFNGSLTPKMAKLMDRLAHIVRSAQLNAVNGLQANQSDAPVDVQPSTLADAGWGVIANRIIEKDDVVSGTWITYIAAVTVQAEEAARQSGTTVPYVCFEVSKAWNKTLPTAHGMQSYHFNLNPSEAMMMMMDLNEESPFTRTVQKLFDLGVNLKFIASDEPEVLEDMPEFAASIINDGWFSVRKSGYSLEDAHRVNCRWRFDADGIIRFRAMRTVQPGEELLTAYGPWYWNAKARKKKRNNSRTPNQAFPGFRRGFLK